MNVQAVHLLSLLLLGGKSAMKDVGGGLIVKAWQYITKYNTGNAGAQWLQCVTSQSDPNQCSTERLGINHKRSDSDAQRDEFLYLNTINPSDCWGTIQRIDFCYYSPSISLRSSNSVYQAVFGIYRSGLAPDGSSVVYNLVSDVHTIQRTQSEVDNDLDYDDGEYDDGDRCRNFDLLEPVRVNPGDILGACIFDPQESTIHQLDIVRLTNDNDEILLRAATTGCSSTTLPLTVSDFTMTGERIMHLYANIGKYCMEEDQ